MPLVPPMSVGPVGAGMLPGSPMPPLPDTTESAGKLGPGCKPEGTTPPGPKLTPRVPIARVVKLKAGGVGCCPVGCG